MFHAHKLPTEKNNMFSGFVSLVNQIALAVTMIHQQEKNDFSTFFIRSDHFRSFLHNKATFKFIFLEQ